MPHLDPTTTVTDPSIGRFAVLGLGSLATWADMIHNGVSLVSIVAPLLLGVAALGQMGVAYLRLRFDKERFARELERDRAALVVPPVVASPAAVGPAR